MKEKVAIYCRISVEDEYKKGESESIQNQRILLEDYSNHQDWEIYQIYCDENYSGLDDDRPQFKKMLFEAQQRKFQIIVCKTQSRFTRNMETVEKYIHNLFLVWGIRFVTVVDHIDTNVEGNKKARQLNGLINEWYCEEISENIRAVFKKKMELGQFLGPYASYGYQKSKEDKHHLLVDEKAAKTVKEIYGFYLNGKSIKQIAAILTKRGVLTPSEYKKSNGMDKNRKNIKYPCRWSENTIRKILNNQIYTGCIVQGKEKKLNYKSKKVIAVPRHQWIIVENMHEAIIDEETFQKVQLYKSKRKKSL